MDHFFQAACARALPDLGVHMTCQVYAVVLTRVCRAVQRSRPRPLIHVTPVMEFFRKTRSVLLISCTDQSKCHFRRSVSSVFELFLCNLRRLRQLSDSLSKKKKKKKKKRPGPTDVVELHHSHRKTIECITFIY